MKNRLLLYLGVGLILVVLAIMVDRSYKDSILLQQYADELSVYTGRQMTEAESWVNGHREMLGSFVAIPDNGNAGQSERLRLGDKPYTILLHKRDSLLFWSKSNDIPGALFLLELSNNPGKRIESFPLGQFAVSSRPFQDATISILVPVRYSLQGDGYSELFPANPGVPQEVVVSDKLPGSAIMFEGQAIGHLQVSGSIQPRWVQWLKLFAYGVLFLLVCIWLNRLALGLAKKVHPAAGMGIVAAFISVFWYLNNELEFTATSFNRLPIFSPPFDHESVLGNTAADWLLYCSLLLWAAVFFHRVFKLQVGRKTPTVGLPMASGVYLVLMSGVLLNVLQFRELVFKTGIDFNFGDVLNLQSSSFATLGSIILFLASLFLVGHRLMLMVREMKLPVSYRIGAQLLAAALFAGLAMLGPLNPGMFYLIGLGILYAAVFDAFIHWEQPGFSWVVLWLLLFTVFAAFLLNRYNTEKSEMQRMAYAEELAAERDTSGAERLIRDLEVSLNSDDQLAFLLKPWPFKPEYERLYQYVNQISWSNRYLFEQFRLRLYAFDGELQPLIQDQATSWQEIVSEQWEQAKSMEDSKAVRYLIDKNGVFKYILRISKERMMDPSQPANLFCVFEQSFVQADKVYEQLFYKSAYKGMDELADYDFAVYREGKLLVEQGQPSPAAVNAPINKGEVRVIYSGKPGRQDAIAKSKTGKSLAVVGKVLPPWYRQLYLFAILFALSSIVLLVLATVNPFFQLLPDYFEFQLSTKGSLSRRIHYWNIALIVVAFMVVGIMTYRHFNRSAAQADRSNFDYRTNAVLVHLRNQFGDLPAESDSLGREIRNSLRPLSASLALDVNMYNPSGDMVFSSRSDLQGLGLIPGKMSAAALEQLRSRPQNDLERQEQLGGQNYLNQYKVLRNNQNQVLAYLSVPYSFTRRESSAEVSDFMGMLASLYVFLLLIAGVATLALANSIIKPVRLISDKIKELKLEDKNEPLSYEGDRSDELGELINEYNRMVDKLEDSKTQLIRMEKEGAWREMARQIAHDIKNPLTTMKLSMQQLQRVSDDPMQAAAYLKKAITRLIEQIDSLAQIASEFSMFANLDIRQRSDLVLNDVVESVYDLFTEQKEVDLQLDLPLKRYHVSGDKGHLIRVFNNLVINAIQAIPEGRTGRIQVALKSDGDLAVVQISDNGGGIPEDIQKRVFEPNFTTKSSGSGLGLAICRRIIEALDGTIQFETRPKEGTDFYISLPIVSVEEPEIA